MSKHQPESELPEDQRALLVRVAREAMTEYGLEPEFPAKAMAEAGALEGRPPDGASIDDLRTLLWCSIDNDDSRDLDQLTVAEGEVDGGTRILVAIADVSATVEPGSAIDAHAGVNTTSVYTPARIFPMLPERLSTDLTSLNPGEDRPAVVVGMTVDDEGAVVAEDVRRALVHNHAQLAYPSVGAWLEKLGPMPPALAAVPGLAENVRLQHTVAQRLRARRHEQGALQLQTLEVDAVFDGDIVSGLVVDPRDRAKELIEDFMIAANGVVARHLAGTGYPVLRRVVHEPERWPRIVELADAHGFVLPEEPDAPSLNAFLLEQSEADPERFPDLSLAIIKLLGSGVYEATRPGRAHRRPLRPRRDALRALHGAQPPLPGPDHPAPGQGGAAPAAASPYSADRLASSPTTARARKTRRRRSSGACASRPPPASSWSAVGDEFDGFITGASPKGTWVRLIDPPVEGRSSRARASSTWATPCACVW